MTLKEAYDALGLKVNDTDVKIYQFKDELQDEIIVFDNIMNNVDRVPEAYLDKKIVWFTWYTATDWLEVHLEA